MVHIGNDWDELLKEEFAKESYQNLRQFLIKEYNNGPVYPPMHELFAALKFTPYKKVRAVILGQDPYHGPGQAHGLCFSVRPEVRIPPSLVNIHKELQLEYGYPLPHHGNLESWATEGVLLLNTILSVAKGKPMSHANKGWEVLTDAIISKLSQRREPMVFLLWGSAAQKKRILIDDQKHLVLMTSHPSPLSAHRGFLGSHHFGYANDFLVSKGQSPINWEIPVEYKQSTVEP